MTASDVMQIPGKWEISYQYSAGRTATRFLGEIKANGHLLGTRCPGCKRVLMPPRAFCERCFERLDEWVEVKNVGSITSLTTVVARFEGLPDPPYIIALVKLDGADTSIANFVLGTNLSNVEEAMKRVRVGTRVEVVFKEERAGRITDFHFRVIGSG